MKKIAVFTSHVYEQMSGMMQKGLVDAAKRYGVKLIFFASFGDSYSSKNYGEFSKYDEGDCVSFDIPDLNDFDGVIKISTYFSEVIKQHLKQILTDHDIPVINIGSLEDDHISISCDEAKTYAKTVRHVIEEHGCRDIFHVAGDKNHSFTFDRIAAYKKELEDHGITFDENKIFYSNLWYDCGDSALDFILETCKKNGKRLPDAVCCANDYSAIGLINACKVRGINIPEDMIITGFDAVVESTSGFPTLTTATQPFYKYGYMAIETMLRIIGGEEIKDNIFVEGDLICNQSCRCKPKSVDGIDDFRVIYTRRLDYATGIAQSTTNLMLTVSDAGTLEDCFRAISDNAKTDTGFKEMLLCLAPGWDKQRIVGEDFRTTDEEMTVVSGYRGDTDVPVQTFRKKNILPQDMLEDPNPYYIFALHHLQYYMGYLIVVPEIGLREQKAIQSWFVDLGVILETRRIQRDLELSVARLKFLYNRDTLTDLYNRRGLEDFFKEYLDECVRNRTGLAVITIDMDDLKYVNDNFGHNEGDYGLKTIAYGLTRAVNGNEVCARAGGDEFTVLAKNYTKEKAEEFIARVRSIIEQKVLLDGKQFNVSVSCGAYIEYPDGSIEEDAHSIFEKCLKEADKTMYKEKKQHKVGRGRIGSLTGQEASVM